MKFVPFENITYQTKLSSEEIVFRIDRSLRPPMGITDMFNVRKLLDERNARPYEGSVNSQFFSISRVISYKNSFLPRVKGSIVKDLNGTKINVKMRLHPLVMVFMFIWLGFTGFGFISFLIFSIQRGVLQPAMLMPLLMVLLGYTLMTGAFKVESLQTKEFLFNLFEAETID